MGKLRNMILCSALSFWMAANGFSQQPILQTDKYKLIPEKVPVTKYDLDKNGKIDTYWWDKNNNGIEEDDEVFYDLNEDGIPDISDTDARKYLREHEKEHERKSSVNPSDKLI